MFLIESSLVSSGPGKGRMVGWAGEMDNGSVNIKAGKQQTYK